MDVCCLNRPFDNPSQDRVIIEAEAVLTIVNTCARGTWVLLSSGAIEAELSRVPDKDILDRIMGLYSAASDRVMITDTTEVRASRYYNEGMDPFDSLHLALAVEGLADVLLTVDDRMIKTAARIGSSIRVANPVNWLMEVI